MTRPPEDWRRLPAAEVVPHLEAEAQRWRADLTWDVTESWKPIEPARAAGDLPGFVVRDGDGRISGWSCFLLHQRTLQVAMIVADESSRVAALVESILASPEAGRAATCTVCVRDAAPGIGAALRVRGFDVATYRYLTAPLGVPGPIEPPCRPWEIEDAAWMSRLCARAYTNGHDARAFAPHGSMDEWHEYIASLVTGPGCGRFLPSASFAIPGRQPRRLDGAIITTDLGLGTAHIAQVAVDPDARGQGWGRALVSSSLASSAAAGYRRATLLVAERNAPAAALYADLGFTDRSRFIVAVRHEPRRLRSVATRRVAVETT